MKYLVSITPNPNNCYIETKNLLSRLRNNWLLVMGCCSSCCGGSCGDCCSDSKIDRKKYPNLYKASKMTKTASNHSNINTQVLQKLTTRAQQNVAKAKSSGDVKQILSPPYNAVDKITDNVYLTGAGGMIRENIVGLRISFIMNATYELPNFDVKGLECIRVPIEDTVDDNISLYLEEVADKLNEVVSKNRRAIVHCVAGKSRSSSLVLAYLVKYQKMTLKEAFIHCKTCRDLCQPNVGFWKSLIEFERKILRKTSVQMTSITIKGDNKEIPDIYVDLFKEMVYSTALETRDAAKKKSIYEMSGRKMDKTVNENVSDINDNKRKQQEIKKRILETTRSAKERQSDAYDELKQQGKSLHASDKAVNKLRHERQLGDKELDQMKDEQNICQRLLCNIFCCGCCRKKKSAEKLPSVLVTTTESEEPDPDDQTVDKLWTQHYRPKTWKEEMDENLNRLRADAEEGERELKRQIKLSAQMKAKAETETKGLKNTNNTRVRSEVRVEAIAECLRRQRIPKQHD
ncbi:unnamed protein product [Medioppia subpectinata]|uniref:Uncharacterized protein n=1 Tax=Medioppia subpectinata TaxID=1979941 RepID=A0A7R9Q7N8_9ACAR|nr:unnamed protein product [Medioppia subpectinata]CAG2115004.1 unnamed protein product [Medioppia subpectinata]